MARKKKIPGKWVGDRYEMTVDVQKGAIPRKQMRRSFTTYTEAETWYRNEVEPAYVSGRRVRGPEETQRVAPALPERLRFAQAADQWWTFYLRERGHAITPKTKRLHQDRLRLRLLPRFGQMWVDEIQIEDVMDFRDDLCEEGYSVSTSSGHLVTLRLILGYLQARGYCRGNAASEIRGREPATPLHRVAQIKQAIPLEKVAEMVSIMPRHYRAVVWAQRLGGLRVSEVFGLRRKNLIFGPGFNFVQVRGQGGQRFEVDNPDGTVSVVPFVARTKSETGRRDVPVCSTLANILTEHLSEYCLGDDPDDVVFCVPDAALHRVENYRQHLLRAARTAGVVDADGVPIATHVLRKSFATDLADEGVSDYYSSTALGHSRKASEGGSEVTSGTYQLAPQQQRLHDAIVPVFDRRVVEAGISVSLDSPEDGGVEGAIPLSLARTMLGLDDSPRRIDHLVRDGSLTLSESRVQGSGRERFVTIKSVLALREKLDTGVREGEILERYELTYDQLQRFKKDYGINPVRALADRNFLSWSDSDIEKLESALETERSLQEGAVTIAEASKRLGLCKATVATLTKEGILQTSGDGCTTSFGVRAMWITEESIEEYLRVFGGGSLFAKYNPGVDAPLPEKLVTYSEASKMLGKTDAKYAATLATKGVLVRQKVPGRKAGYVTRDSVEALLAERADKRRAEQQVPKTRRRVTVHRAAHVLGVAEPTLTRNAKAWGLTITTVKAGASKRHTLDLAQVREVGVPAAAAWRASREASSSSKKSA